MPTTNPTAPTVVLVHGAWADGSSWQRVIPILLDEGMPVVAVQNPTSSLAADAAATKVVLNAIEGPVVLVGHSWGGAVITEAGNDPKVEALVYVAAFAPDAGETLGELVNAHPAPPSLSQVQDDGAGNLKLSVKGWISDVGQDLPEAETRVLSVLQPPLPASTFGDKVSAAAWRTKPCWYVVSAQDRVVSVELEHMFAERMGATTSEVDASHLSILSQPKAIAQVIVNAASRVSSLTR